MEKETFALALRAPDGWYGQEEIDETTMTEAHEEVSISDKTRRRAWARPSENRITL